MKIPIKNLKNLCEKILTRAEQSGLKEVEIDIDYYRIIDDIYNLKTNNPQFIIGSFIDDWESLQKILCDKNPPTTLDFERLGNVIKITGDSISKSNKVII
jgi:hypothetical protein